MKLHLYRLAVGTVLSLLTLAAWLFFRWAPEWVFNACMIAVMVYCLGGVAEGLYRLYRVVKDVSHPHR